MNTKDILHCCDHTMLKQTSTWKDIRSLIDEGIEYETASVCIPPSFVAEAKEYAGSYIPICTVIGFPNGYSTTAVKLYETVDAINNGADEIDMVINLGWVKDKKWDLIENEIITIKKACGEHILKVIIETCFLTKDEIIKLCRIVSASGADYIKTSTGFGSEGATADNVKIMVNNVESGVKVKAAGGINGLDDAANFLEAGASRLGTSRVVKAVKNTLKSE